MSDNSNDSTNTPSAQLSDLERLALDCERNANRYPQLRAFWLRLADTYRDQDRYERERDKARKW